jgi:hypothetical protein
MSELRKITSDSVFKYVPSDSSLADQDDVGDTAPTGSAVQGKKKKKKDWKKVDWL